MLHIIYNLKSKRYKLQYIYDIEIFNQNTNSGIYFLLLKAFMAHFKKINILKIKKNNTISLS